MKKIVFMAGFLIAWALLQSGCSDTVTEPDPVPSLMKVTDIPYISGDTSKRHKLDIYYRPNTTPNKVLFFVPGGAWRQGDKSLYQTMGSTLAGHYPYTVVAINYRLSNPDEGNAVHPDHINDVLAAFDWAMKNIAKYGGDPSQVFLFGQSAGGHLVSLLATDETYLMTAGYSFANIRGAISMSGAYDLPDLVDFPSNPLGLTAEETLMYKAIIAGAFGSYDSAVTGPASPAWHVNSTIPPFLLITTDLDMPGFMAEGDNFLNIINSYNGTQAQLYHLAQSDYSPETWAAATQLAAQEPLLSDYIGHYAEVVAINENDHLKVPTTCIVQFITEH